MVLAAASAVPSATGLKVTLTVDGRTSTHLDRSFIAGVPSDAGSGLGAMCCCVAAKTACSISPAGSGSTDLAFASRPRARTEGPHERTSPIFGSSDLLLER